MFPAREGERAGKGELEGAGEREAMGRKHNDTNYPITAAVAESAALQQGAGASAPSSHTGLGPLWPTPLPLQPVSSWWPVRT